jgi:hypothetical protein
VIRVFFLKNKFFFEIGDWGFSRDAGMPRFWKRVLVNRGFRREIDDFE